MPSRGVHFFDQKTLIDDGYSRVQVFQHLIAPRWITVAPGFLSRWVAAA
jgi:hypothetical protein